MTSLSQTPLSRANISAAEQAILRSLWIESVEEALAASTALMEVTGSPEKAALAAIVQSPNLQKTVGSERYSELKNPQPGGFLGCLVDEQALADYRQRGRLRSRTAVPAGVFEEKLPPFVRLMDRMMPIRDQGERGTCVAFGTVALREFLIGLEEDLSEQFLYWACKQLDGHDGPGTWIRTAMTALSEYGVCRESVWPYNPKQTDREDQDPPPPGAVEDARRYVLRSARTVEPNLVIQYKNILCGENGRGGMPITFGTFVFKSWYMSRETHRTGKITMPLPGEEPYAGHAWCVVGYVDNPAVPGGGYFIVRNSWGTDWAAESPEKAGHALMPYAYVERYALEAFTGPVESQEQPEEYPLTKVPEYCCRVLDRDERDLEGRLLKKGTKILFHPVEAHIFKEDNEIERATFLAHDCTWTDDARRYVWFPPLAEFRKNNARQEDSIRRSRAAFRSAINDNMIQAKGKAVPEVKSLPFWYSALAWEPKITEVTETPEDLAPALAKLVMEKSGVPRALEWPAEWRKWLEELNEMKIYTLRGLSTTFHVIAAMPVFLRFSRPREIAWVPLNHEIIDSILSLYGEWAARGKSRATFRFFTLGWTKDTDDRREAETAWPGLDSGNHRLFISSFQDGRLMATIPPPLINMRLSLRNFADLLCPETRNERLTKIHHFVRTKLIDEHYEGNLTVRRIQEASKDFSPILWGEKKGSSAARAGYRRTTILMALFELKKLGQYRVYKTNDVEIAIGRLQDVGIGTPVSENILRPSLLGRLAFLFPAIAATLYLIRDLFGGKALSIPIYVVSVTFSYLIEWLRIQFQKAKDKKE